MHCGRSLEIVWPLLGPCWRQTRHRRQRLVGRICGRSHPDPDQVLSLPDSRLHWGGRRCYCQPFRGGL